MVGPTNNYTLIDIDSFTLPDQLKEVSGIEMIDKEILLLLNEKRQNEGIVFEDECHFYLCNGRKDKNESQL